MPFLGMRGTGDWETDERPKNWREAILYLYPNGKAPLTAIMSKMGDEGTDDPEFNWWTKELPLQAGTLTNIFTDAALSTAYTSGGTRGDTLYIQLPEELSKEFRAGHTVQISVEQDPRYETVAKVTASTQAGSSSYLTVVLREDADGTYDLNDANWVEVIGNSNPEGAEMPDNVSYNPVKRNNYTQILRTPLKITRTARKTRLRTGDAYNRMKEEALELNSIEIEKAFLWSIADEWVGGNSKPERTTRGAIKAVKEFAPDNIFDFRFDEEFNGDTWIQSGETWFEKLLEVIFRYGETEKLALCGSGALQGIQRLAKAGATLNIEVEQASYGIKVARWETAHGTLFLKTHPLMTQNSSHRYSMFICEPRRLRTRFVDDVYFKEDNSETEVTNNSRDSTEEEYLGELGVEHHHEKTMAYLSGLNMNNPA